MTQKTERNNRLMKRASWASITTAGVLVILKFIAFLMTGSMAILSGLFDSVQDLMTSGVNAVAVHHATHPADCNHRFGHGKAEALGGVVQGFIIATAAVFLGFEAVNRFFHPQTLERLSFGIVITGIALGLTALLISFQSYVIRQTNSLSIKADRAHYTGDILMNVGILVSMLATYFLNWTCVDALFGIGVSLYLLFVVYQVMKEAFSMLMDTEMPNAFRLQIEKIALACPEVREICDLKTRQSGHNTFVQFCVRLDQTLTLAAAHDITDLIEENIRHHFPDVELMIHPEPYKDIHS